MPFTIVDDGEGQNAIQSILFQEDLDILVAGIAGTECVLSGGAVTAQGAPNMTVAVAKAAVLSQGVMFAVAGNASVAIGAANATNPRIDLVVITSAGAIAVRAGTAAAAPKPPARTAGDVALAKIWVPANDTTISTDQITDMRMPPPRVALIYKQTAADTINNTAAAIELLNRTNAGVTIPDGLFLAGKTLRLRMGGNILYNSGTPTFTIAVLFGGTTMFSDVSAVSTADADRAPWAIDLNLVAQGNADQALIGSLMMGIIAAKTAPTTGLGDAWSTANNVNAIAGSAAVDSDAANRLLSVRGTFNVANAANEIVVEFVTLELLG